MAVVIGLLFAGYFMLGGLDYGVSMVSRGRSELDRIAPFFLGNEVWLVAAAGVFLGAYPLTEGELFTAHRLPVGLGLLGAVIVVAALGMRLFSRRSFLDLLARVGGFVAAVGWGAALGDVIGLWPVGAVALPVLLAVHGWAFLRRNWLVLLLSSAIIVAAVVYVGSRIDWQPAPASTLDVIAPVALVFVPVLIVIQAFSWWLFRDGVPPRTRPEPVRE